MTTNFFSPLSFVAVFGSGIRDQRSGIRDPGSGMGKNQDPGSGIRDKHPGSATLPESQMISRFDYGPYAYAHSLISLLPQGKRYE
jgi:hypothetical protein